MSERIWLGAHSLVGVTRRTAFRTVCLVLTLTSLFGSRPEAQFPNCNCSTLYDLCNSGNYQSCDYYAAYCNGIGTFFDCMWWFDDAEWSQQFPVLQSRSRWTR